MTIGGSYTSLFEEAMLVIDHGSSGREKRLAQRTGVASRTDQRCSERHWSASTDPVSTGCGPCRGGANVADLPAPRLAADFISLEIDGINPDPVMRWGEMRSVLQRLEDQAGRVFTTAEAASEALFDHGGGFGI